MVIPARYASSRLPGKPLLDIAGKPMLQHVYERASESAATDVIVATDDGRVAECARGFGAIVCETSSDHPSGTDRLAEVARMLGFADDAVIVNVQGDEPLIPPANINQVADNLVARQEADMATLSEPLTEPAQLDDPNLVKVVTNALGFALYFSRACIPWPRDGLRSTEGLSGWRRHVGIYAYRAGFLQTFVAWPACELERIESLEQLRALWHGAGVHVEEARETSGPGIDTEEDLASVRALLAAT